MAKVSTKKLINGIWRARHTGVGFHRKDSPGNPGTPGIGSGRNSIQRKHLAESHIAERKRLGSKKHRNFLKRLGK